MGKESKRERDRGFESVAFPGVGGEQQRLAGQHVGQEDAGHQVSYWPLWGRVRLKAAVAGKSPQGEGRSRKGQAQLKNIAPLNIQAERWALTYQLSLTGADPPSLSSLRCNTGRGQEGSSLNPGTHLHNWASAV